jgi:PAS domain S-box-containing protein
MSIPKLLSLLLIPAYIVLIAVLEVLNIQTVFEPPLLLPLLNTVFLGIFPLCLAFIAGRVYLRSDSLSVLLMGCGMLTFGICSVAAGWVRGMADGANMTVVLHNIGVFVGGFLHLLGSILNFVGRSSPDQPTLRKWTVTTAYGCLFLFGVVLVFATLRDMVPPFFVQGVGPTVLRQLVLGAGVVFYFISSLFFLRTYTEWKSDFLYWYALGLAITAIGLSAIFLQQGVGCPIGWLGRSAQYISAFFFLAALAAASKRARDKSLPLERIIANFFADAETSYRDLVETARDAIVSFDNEGRIIRWNAAAETMFGHTKDEAIGSPFFELLVPEGQFSLLNEEIQRVAARPEKSLSERHPEIEGRRRDGSHFPMDVSTSVRDLATGRVTTCIMRDVTERALATKALRHREETLRAILAASPVGIVFTQDSRIKWANDSWMKMFGFVNEDEFLDQPTSLMHPSRESYATVRRIVYDQIESARISEADAILMRKDGALFDGRIRINLIDASDPSKGTISAITDISERKKAENALQKASDEFQAVIEASPVAIIVFDQDSIVNFWNPAAEVMFGWSATEATGKFLPFVPEDKKEEHVGIRQRTLQGERLTGIEARRIRKDGSIIDVIGSTAPLHDSKGAIAGVMAVLLDITDRKKADEALRESEERFRTMTDWTYDWEYWVDPLGRLKYMSPSCERVTGFGPKEFTDDPGLLSRIVHPADRATYEEHVHSLYQPDQHSEKAQLEFRIIARDRAEHWIEHICRRVYGADGAYLGKRVSNRDVTARKRAEAKIERQSALLSAINSVLRETLESETDADLAQTCLRMAEKITGSRFGFVGEVNEAGRLDTTAVSDPAWEACTLPKSDVPLLIHDMEIRGIWGLVLKEEKSQIINDPATHPDSVGVPNGHPPLTSFMGVPLERSGKTFGLIALANKEGGYVASDLADVEALSAAYVEAVDKKRAERALSLSEEKYRSIFENIVEGIFQSTPSGRFTTVNPACARMFGYDSPEQMVSEVTDIARQLYVRPDEREDFRELLDDPGALEGHVVECRRKDGAHIWVSVNAKAVREESGRVLYYEGTFEDITARRRAEQALRESEEKYRALVERAHEGIIVAQDGMHRFVNPAVIQIWGYSEEELLSRPFADFMHPVDGEMVLLRQLGRAKGEKPPGRYAFRILTKDGETKWVEIDAAEISWQGKPAALVLMSDVTERKQAEEALKQSEEWYRSIVEESFDGIFVQKGSTIMFANARLCDMLGYSSGELKGLKHWMVYHPDYHELTRQRAVARMRGEDVVSQYEVKLQRKDGSSFEGEINAKRVTVDGEPGVQVWVRDLSKRKRLEDVQRRLAAAIEQAGEAIVITDLRGNVVYANPAHDRITGYTREEVIGSPPPFFREHELDRQIRLNIVNAMGKGRVWAGRIAGRRKDGTLCELDATIAPVRDPSGQMVSRVGVERDVTHEVRLQQELLQAQKMETIGTLAGGIAHDFNNLLQVVLGYSELLLAEKDQNHPEYADLQKIFHAAKNGGDLVQRLLMFSRKTEPKPVPMNLNRQVLQVEKLLRRTIPRMIDIQLELAADLPEINADLLQIEQVLMNLAVSARDAMPDVGKLTVRTDIVMLDEEYCRFHVEANPGEHVLLEVSDTGHGMDKETVEHIFEPFFTTKEAGRGTGLGLAMVYGIVTQHGGHITVYSEVDKGTTFRVYLPAIPTEEEPAVEDSGIMPAFGTETVLLVDDEELVRDLGARILSKHGYTVLLAQNGSEAINIFENKHSQISLVILDLIMPEMGGTECLKELLKIDPNVRVLVASGFSADASVRETIQIGAKGFISKPFRVKEILREVRKVLDEAENLPVNGNAKH